jgi:hypothetical protein
MLAATRMKLVCIFIYANLPLSELLTHPEKDPKATKTVRNPGAEIKARIVLFRFCLVPIRN